jgi:hypothetical protein
MKSPVEKYMSYPNDYDKVLAFTKNLRPVPSFTENSTTVRSRSAPHLTLAIKHVAQFSAEKDV